MLYFENNYSPNDMVKIIHENFFFYKWKKLIYFLYKLLNIIVWNL
jgi:hypothetical protein